MPISLKFDWPRQIAWVRVLLVAATVGISYFWPSHVAPLVVFYGLLGVYLVLSLVVAVRGIRPGGLLGMLALFCDAVYFLALVSFGADRLWLASFFFLYLLAEALAFYGPVEVAMVVAVAAVFCAVLPYDGTRCVLVAGALTCGYAVHKRHRSARIEQLKEKLEFLTTTPIGLRGHVTVVQEKWGFLVLDVGHTQRVQPNAEFLVYRDTKLIGKVQIVSVAADNCIGQIMPEYQRSTPVVGDLIIH